MNKRRLGRPVLTEAGVAARVTNAAEWEAPPGMEKRRCRRCSIGSLHQRTAIPCAARPVNAAGGGQREAAVSLHQMSVTPD